MTAVTTPKAMDDWVPHRGAMSLLDRVERVDEHTIVAWVRVPTLEPLRGTKAHVGALLDRCDTAAELVDVLSGAR